MTTMLTEICQEIRNWFDRGLDKYAGNIVIQDGNISFSGCSLKDGQYYRIIGSVFNDGVHVFPVDGTLRDEIFDGIVWAMAVPVAVVSLAGEIEQWLDKYGGADGVLASPYQSESFGGYSYSKASSASGNGKLAVGSWQSAFAGQLNRWRKI